MANFLTILRIIFTLPLCIEIYKYGINIEVFLIFTLLGITDFLDGYIARKYNKTSELGNILDGFADKFLMILITIVLLIKNIIPFWTLIIFIRDIFAIIYVLFYNKKYKKIIKSNIYGKLKTTLHIISIAYTLFLGRWSLFSSILIISAIILFIPEIIYTYKSIKNK